MAPVPESVIDTLNGLLEAEANNVFRFVAESSPHIGPADAVVREPITELNRLSQRHTRELSDLIVSRGGSPKAKHHVRPADQHLAYLSLKFLMPKLVAEKDLILTRYENAKAQIGPDYPDVAAILARIEQEQRHYLDILSRAAEAVTGGKYHAPPHDQPAKPARKR